MTVDPAEGQDAARLEPSQDLVVIGASAGGIDALSRLVTNLPAGFPAPIVIAQHLEPSRISHLQEILARRTVLTVRTAGEHEPLEPGVIFVVPSNRDVEITDSTITMPRDIPGRPKPSIDHLLASAAEVYGERLIAVILTGTGSDGADGARRVKEAGGTVILQDPKTAQFPELPRSLPASTVDIVADLEDIGPLLHDLLTGVYIPLSSAEDGQFKLLLDQVRNRSGIDFGRYREPTIRRRLQRRMADSGQLTIDEYSQYLGRHPEEYDRLVGSFLIKVTDFFRDPELFDVVREQILPELIAEARRRDHELRIWSAGCATGEEAYSLAMLVADALGAEADEFSVRIFATDIDQNAVAYARRGLYGSSAVERVPAATRNRYFSRVDDRYEVKKAVRRMVVFAPHDLGQRAPFPRIDLALCRNVLIYFTPELQRRALQLFAFALRPAGRLILGKSETTSPLPEHFAVEDARLKVYRRRSDRVLISTADIRTARSAPDAAGPVQSGTVRRERQPQPTAGLPRARRGNGARRESAEELLLDLPVGVVVVDRRYDVQAINAAARRLLSLHTMVIGEDLIHLARRLQADRLRSLIDQAFGGGSGSDRLDIRPLDAPAGTTRTIEVTCFPRRTDGSVHEVENVVVLVSDVTQATVDSVPSQPPPPPELATVTQALAVIDQASRDDAEAGQARAALASAHDALTAVLAAFERQAIEAGEQAELRRDMLLANQDLTATNTALRSQNEELLVANEETQAAMEEVETLSEEQQASNEELETLNEELQATIEELNTTNDDLGARSAEVEQGLATLESERARLTAILASIGDAVLVVDAAGRTIMTNTTFDEMFGDAGIRFVPEDDQGRPFPRRDWPQRRAADGQTFNIEFSLPAADGTRRRYEAGGRPVQFDGHQNGVIVIRDITYRGLLQLQDEFMAMASHELRTPLTALLGYLQLHLQRIDSGRPAETLRGSAAAAVRQADHLRVLVDDLLDAGRLRTGRLTLRPEQTDLAELAARVVTFAESLVPDKSIELSVPPEPLMLSVDPVRIEQVLFNLISNAHQHAPDATMIAVSVRADGDMAEVVVRDDGPGIPEPEAQQLFSRFYQVTQTGSRSARGLGLGLYIAREIVLEHGGTIEVTSHPGAGAAFTVRLPR